MNQLQAKIDELESQNTKLAADNETLMQIKVKQQSYTAKYYEKNFKNFDKITDPEVKKKIEIQIQKRRANARRYYQKNKQAAQKYFEYISNEAKDEDKNEVKTEAKTEAKDNK